MAIAITKLDATIMGDRKIVFWKAVISGTTATGDVDLATLGLKRVAYAHGVVKSATASGVNFNEDFPTSNDLTIVTHNNDETVYGWAIGDPV